MLNWSGLVSVLIFVTIVLAIYLLITRSAGIYTTNRQFWLTALLSAGISYLVSGALFLFLHLNATVAVAVSAVVPFLVGNLDLGGTAVKEPAPSDEGLALEDPLAEGDEDEEEALAEEEDEGGEQEDWYKEAQDEEGEGESHEITISSPGPAEPFWN